MPFPLYLLALAVFAMGTSEFMLAGLLPDIAAEFHVPDATAGLLTSAFAAGMVVGAPLMAALGRHWPPRSALVCSLTLFLATHVVGAVTGSFPVLLATRLVAALANAGFLAVALTTATALVPAHRKGRALAILLGGTTVATIVGVPGGALLAAPLGWRAPFWTVALLCLPAALGVLHGIPAPTETGTGAGGGAAADGVRAAGGGGLHRELGVLRRPGLVVVMVVAALVNAGTFGSFTFLGLLVTGVAGVGPLWIPVVLALFGVGSFAGVTVAGRVSDRWPGAVVAVAGPLLAVGWVAVALTAGEPGALLALAPAQGMLSFSVGSTLIARVLYAAAGAPIMAGSYATAALNVGAAAGPVLAAATLHTGLAERGPAWASATVRGVRLLTR
jgi:DHA1 family chloramphenicol resistance protein-like MFS transporter